MRLRLTFGGGRPRTWSGWVALSEGEFRNPQPLGLEPDEPGSLGVGVRVIQIRQPSPRSYDGLDVDVHASLDAVLRLRLAPADAPGEQRQFEFQLSELIDGVHPSDEPAAGRLDETGNRLVISRAPGDRLRVLFHRETLIFSPEEVFRFTVAPHLLGMNAGEEAQLKVRIVSRLTGGEHFSQTHNVKVGEDGSIAGWGPHEFTIPPGDDVYEMVVSIAKPGLLDPLVPSNPLTTAKPVLTRRLQFIALQREAEMPSSAANEDATDAPRHPKLREPPDERLVDELDPVRPNWGERVARWPLLKRIPRMKQGKLSHGENKIIRHRDRDWMQMAPDAWQAHPISIDAPRAPHILEVEYPEDIPQTLGISILEPNALGKISPLGVDTAVEVVPPETGVEPRAAGRTARHRLVFWPKTKTPIVLLTSHDDEQTAVYRKIRVYRIDGPLAPGQPSASRRSPAHRAERRVVGAWLDKPLLPEMFAARDAADRLTARSLDDWRTFYEASSRLSAHLQYAGYNAAVVPALCEGSALYPSDLLEPTPKYDTGVYLTGGHHPQRKDVLELLFRLFDREGLTLFPSLQFNTPLPELELLRGGDPRARIGIELVNREGRTWLERRGTSGGLAPYYNPLDRRVQAAMTAVVRELAERYGHHPSFGGVVLQLSPRGYAMLPGDDWGYDDRTFSHFLQQHKVDDPGVGHDRFEERARWCNTVGRQPWLAWRSERMAALYRGMAAEVRRGKQDARLILAGSKMLDGKALRRVLRPTLSAKPATEQQIRDALLELGVDAKLLAAEPAVALVAPHPEIAAAGRDDEPLWDATAIEALHAQLSAQGSLIFRPPATQRVASFDKASPFGAQNTYTWLAAQVVRSGDARRRDMAECLARGDRTILFDGGWMLPRGQEAAALEMRTLLRHLPAEKLDTAPQSPATQPIVLRTAQREKETLAYLLNHSPWPATVRVSVDAQPLWDVRPLVQGTDAGTRASKVAWTVDLPPHGMVAGVFNQVDVGLHVVDVHLPADLRTELVNKLEGVRRRAAGLKRPQPLKLANAGFEEPPDAEGGVFGWVHAKGEGVEVSLADGGHDGSPRALRIVSRGPEVWVRSQPVPAPTTGRIAVWARLRIPEGEPQPELRLAIEARRDRRPFYRFANVGAGVPQAELSDGWAPFILQINDLPRSGLDEFRIGFDLMGPGEVWIDDVVIYDLSFTEKEQFHISRLIAAADFHLREENIAAAAQVLSGYWPHFLEEHAQPPPVAPPADAPRRDRGERDNAPAAPATRQGFLDKAKGWWPF